MNLTTGITTQTRFQVFLLFFTSFFNMSIALELREVQFFFAVYVYQYV